MDINQFKEKLARYLPPRKQDAHKGDFGHLVVVGGDEGFSGAIRLAGQAAYRVGAGRVTLLAHPSQARLLNASCPELMCRGVNGHDLEAYLQRATTIAFGPGLGQSSWSQEIFAAFIEQKRDIPVVVDADGLNWLAKATVFAKNWILTPHLGEAARLLGQSIETIQADRIAAVRAIQNQYGGVAVLKGMHTLVQGGVLVECPFGNPGMATAGTGDVLTGAIGGLLAQKIPLEMAAELGVYLHALAGDWAAQSGERGLMASDLMPFLRKLVNFSYPSI